MVKIIRLLTQAACFMKILHMPTIHTEQESQWYNFGHPLRTRTTPQTSPLRGVFLSGDLDRNMTAIYRERTVIGVSFRNHLSLSYRRETSCFIHSTLLGCIDGTGTIVSLFRCQWGNPGDMWKIDTYAITTKYDKVLTECMIWGKSCDADSVRQDTLRYGELQISLGLVVFG